MTDSPELPPQLNDPDWARRAEREGKAHVRQLKRQAFWRRHGNKLVSLVALVIIGVVTTLMYRGGDLDQYLPQSLRWSAPAQTSAPAASGPQVDLRQPFLGTPAGVWADGAAGFVAPAPAAAGKYSAEQVGAATERVRQLLAAALLNRDVITGKNFEPAVSLLAPAAQQDLRSSLAPGREAEGNWLITRISPAFRLLPLEPKVNGGMTVSVDKDDALVVRVNYSVAYAFEPESAEKILDPLDIVALVRAEQDFVLRDGPDWPKAQRGLWGGERQDAFHYSISCKEGHKGFLAPRYLERTVLDTSATQLKHDTRHYFDPTKPIDQEDTCRK